MATKDLSRTIIEGGRVGGNKRDRKASNKQARAKMKQHVFVLKNLVNSDDEPKSAPTRRKIYKEFDDKLGAVYRWIASKIGQKWDDVFSELKKRFDTRTIAGRHIIEDHVLRDIRIKAKYETYGAQKGQLRDPTKERYYVDGNGVLKAGENYRRTDNPRVHTPSIKEWAADRHIHISDGVVYWLIPKVDWQSCAQAHKSRNPCLRTHRRGRRKILIPVHTVFGIDKKDLGTEVGDDGNTRYYKEIEVYECRQAVDRTYRQGPKLTEQELAYWNDLDEYGQLRVLHAAVGRRHNKRHVTFGR